MEDFTNAQIIDINILLALTKCMIEVSHNVQYIHSDKEREKIKAVKQSIIEYEIELEKRFDYFQSEGVEAIYDCIMDLILEARQISLDNINKEKNESLGNGL